IADSDASSSCGEVLSTSMSRIDVCESSLRTSLDRIDDSSTRSACSSVMTTDGSERAPAESEVPAKSMVERGSESVCSLRLFGFVPRACSVKQKSEQNILPSTSRRHSVQVSRPQRPQVPADDRPGWLTH